MADSDSTVSNTDVSGMQDFVARYDSDKALDRLNDDSENRAPQSDEGEDHDFDPATLQALGLMPGEEKQGDDSPPPKGEGDAGTEDDSDFDPSTLAPALGLDAGDLVLDNGEVKVRTKVDGEEATVSLNELRKGYQLQSHFTRQNEEFLRQQQAWEAARQQQEMQLRQQAEVAMEVLNHEESQLQQSYTKDWNKLRTEDPAEYAAQVAEYNQKIGQVRQRKQQLAVNVQQRQAQGQQQLLAAVQQMKQQGTVQLAEQLGWKDEKQFKEGAGKLREYLVKSGVTPQEVDTVLDHRALVMADKARRYDELMGKVDLARKKMSGTEAPRTPKGSSPVVIGGRKAKTRRAMNRLREDHSVEAAADVFKNLGIV